METTPPPPPLSYRTTLTTDSNGIVTWNFPSAFGDLPVVFAIPEPAGDTTNAYIPQVVEKAVDHVKVKITKIAPQAVALISLTVGLPTPATNIMVNLYAGTRSS